MLAPKSLHYKGSPPLTTLWSAHLLSLAASVDLSSVLSADVFSNRLKVNLDLFGEQEDK